METQDTVFCEFWNSQCVVTLNHLDIVPVQEVYRSYKEWCWKNRKPVFGQNSLSRWINKRHKFTTTKDFTRKTIAVWRFLKVEGLNEH